MRQLLTKEDVAKVISTLCARGKSDLGGQHHCWDRRISLQEHPERAALRCIQGRDGERILIHWQFSLEKARTRLNTHQSRASSSVQRETEGNVIYGVKVATAAGSANASRHDD